MNTFLLFLAVWTVGCFVLWGFGVLVSRLFARAHKRTRVTTVILHDNEPTFESVRLQRDLEAYLHGYNAALRELRDDT